jgi:hypothetical protein
MTPVEVLTKAKNVLKERGWTQGTYEDALHRVCLLGACQVAAFGNARSYLESLDDICGLLVDAVNSVDGTAYLEDDCEVANWNDDPERTVFDVERVLDRAIVLAAALPSD